MFRKTVPLFTLLAILLFALSACLPGLPIPQSGEQPGQVETSAYATVGAMMTQAAFETLVAELTEVAQPQAPTATLEPVAASLTATITPTDTPTNTPLPPTETSTPVPSLTPLPPTVTSVPCYRAQFVTDVTVPDGATFAPNQGFVKTWRLRNNGSCNWNSDFDLVFTGGSAMNAPAASQLNAVVRPGDIIDIAVSMVAPNVGGSYTGYWMLRTSSGVIFGLGPNGDKNFWVKINVSESSEPGAWDEDHPRDFAYNYCAATWRSGAGYLPCPGAGADFTNGSVARSSSPVLEGGYVDDEMTIIAIPNSGDGGYITGHFPPLRIRDGDRFQAVVGCLNNSKDCDVTFEVLYRLEGTNERTSLGTWEEEYDGSYTRLDLSLASLVGEDVEFYLRVKNNGNNRDDRAFWLAPRIAR